MVLTGHRILHIPKDTSDSGCKFTLWLSLLCAQSLYRLVKSVTSRNENRAAVQTYI